MPACSLRSHTNTCATAAIVGFGVTVTQAARSCCVPSAADVRVHWLAGPGQELRELRVWRWQTEHGYERGCWRLHLCGIFLSNNNSLV